MGDAASALCQGFNLEPDETKPSCDSTCTPKFDSEILQASKTDEISTIVERIK